VPHVSETAAVAVAPSGGPSDLIIYAVPHPGALPDRETLLKTMRETIKRELNPLFRIRDLVLIDALPRTASNKIMRRALRDRYTSAHESS
jgi:acetyl-CoA synthetase